MPQTVAQIDALLTLAYAAIHVNELSFTGPGGRETKFHTLESFMTFITWLEGQRVTAVALAEGEAGTGGYAAVVRNQEPQL